MPNFWEAQKRARSRTWLFLTSFILLTVGMALLIEYVVHLLAVEGYTPPLPYLGIAFLVITFLVALFYYSNYASSGGSMVAESVGGRRVDPATNDFKEQQLLNIVQEMAIASGQPVPPVYILPAKEINAFAAGMTPKNAAIAVTRGSLDKLTRDELQGVVGHEFGHIYNGDMKISMRLAAMVMGFMIVLYLGFRILEGSLLFGGRNDRKGGIAIAALVLILAGLITWFAGALLRSMVSREREYLADACSVQFTRNPEGLVGALRKIGKEADKSDMPKSGMAYAHIYFDNHSFFSKLFATHPSLEKRIKAIENQSYKM